MIMDQFKKVAAVHLVFKVNPNQESNL